MNLPVGEYDITVVHCTENVYVDGDEGVVVVEEDGSICFEY